VGRNESGAQRRGAARSAVERKGKAKLRRECKLWQCTGGIAAGIGLVLLVGGEGAICAGGELGAGVGRMVAGLVLLVFAVARAGD